MPLKPPSNNSHPTGTRGTLFIVATPIGNKDDITLRALDTLKKVDLVAAEDTRKISRLLAQHQIKIKPLSYHDHNETERTKILIKKINYRPLIPVSASLTVIISSVPMIKARPSRAARATYSMLVDPFSFFRNLISFFILFLQPFSDGIEMDIASITNHVGIYLQSI